MNLTNNKQQIPTKQTILYALVLSLSVNLGLILGLVLKNLGMGLSLGLSVALFSNALRDTRKHKPGSRIALVVSLVAISGVMGLWIWFG